MGVSKNNGTPKSPILMEFSIINHPFWGNNIFGNIQILQVPSEGICLDPTTKRPKRLVKSYRDVEIDVSTATLYSSLVNTIV